MKKKGHPGYQKVLFVDSASGHRFVCGSTLQTQVRETFEGVEYPVSYLSISSTSHPFFTGSKGLVDSEGRVQKFNRRFGRKDEVVREVTPAAETHVESPVQTPKAAEPAKKAVPAKAPPAKPAPAKAAPAKAAAPAKPAGKAPANAKAAPADTKKAAAKPAANKKK